MSNLQTLEESIEALVLVLVETEQEPSGTVAKSSENYVEKLRTLHLAKQGHAEMSRLVFNQLVVCMEKRSLSQALVAELIAISSEHNDLMIVLQEQVSQWDEKKIRRLHYFTAPVKIEEQS